MKALLEVRPAVFLVDSLEAASEEQLNWIEHMLRTFVEDTRLFFVLASKRSILFEQAMAVSRRLTTVQLKPFDRTSCSSYVSDTGREHQTGGTGYYLRVDRRISTSSECNGSSNSQ